MTTIENHARLLLLALLAEIEAFAEVPDAVADASEPYAVAMIGTGVPFAPAQWLGRRLSPARRMAFSRAARRLAGTV